jgi:hypothetical protein
MLRSPVWTPLPRRCEGSVAGCGRGQTRAERAGSGVFRAREGLRRAWHDSFLSAHRRRAEPDTFGCERLCPGVVDALRHGRPDRLVVRGRSASKRDASHVEERRRKSSSAWSSSVQARTLRAAGPVRRPRPSSTQLPCSWPSPRAPPRRRLRWPPRPRLPAPRRASPRRPASRSWPASSTPR